MQRTSLVPLLLISGLAACGGERDDAADPAIADAEPREVRTATVDFGHGPVDVEFEVIDGEAVMQGDIVLGPLELVERGDLRFGSPAGLPSEGVAASGLSHLNSWPGGRVPFTIDTAVFPAGSARRAAIDAAIAHWNASTVVRLVPHASNAIEHFVRFSDKSADMSDGEGRAAVGFQPGTTQRIRLGANVGSGVVIHEIGHTVGLFHEQSRADRDDFVIINFANIADDREHNFDTYLVDGLIGLDFGGYDLGSIMHYGSFFFAVDPAVPTIVRKRAGCSATSTAAACLINPPAVLSTRDKVGVTRQVTGDPLLKFRVRNEGANTCLRPVGGSTTVGAAVVLDTCSNTASRRWYEFTRPGTSNPMWVNEGSRLCLTRAANNRMIQTHCDGGAAQRFAIADVFGLFNGDHVKQGTRCMAKVANETATFMSTSCATDVSTWRWFRDFI